MNFFSLSFWRHFGGFMQNDMIFFNKAGKPPEPPKTASEYDTIILLYSEVRRFQ